jgi:hypothetical protein
MTAEIYLSSDDLRLAKSAAEYWRAFNRGNNVEHINPPKGGFTARDDAFMNLQGAASEIALARWLGFVDFEPSRTQYSSAPDVAYADFGGRVAWLDVRATRYKRGRLIVRQKDLDKHHTVICVLAHHTSPAMDYWEFKGWEVASAVVERGERYDKNNRPACHWLQQNLLRPMEELKALKLTAVDAAQTQGTISMSVEQKEYYTVPGRTRFVRQVSEKAVVLENDSFPEDPDYGKQLLFPKSATTLSPEGVLRVETWLAEQRGLTVGDGVETSWGAGSMPRDGSVPQHADDDIPF